MLKVTDEVKEKLLSKKDFREQYRAIVLRQGVPEVRAEWYVKWIQKFARYMSGVPLRVRTAVHVKGF